MRNCGFSERRQFQQFSELIRMSFADETAKHSWNVKDGDEQNPFLQGSGYQSMQVDICNWQFFSGFLAIHYWDATQMLNSPREWCIFSTIEGFFDKIYRLAWLPTHTPHTQKELLTQNLQARSGFSSVKLSPLLLPTLISTFHISLSSKQLRHNVPIRGNYPHSSNYYVIFLHFRGVEYKCLVSAEAIWGWRC